MRPRLFVAQRGQFRLKDLRESKSKPSNNNGRSLANLIYTFSASILFFCDSSSRYFCSSRRYFISDSFSGFSR